MLASVLQVGGFLAMTAGLYVSFGLGPALMVGGSVIFLAGGLEGRRRGEK